MINNNDEHSKSSGKSSNVGLSSKDIVESRLREAGVDTRRFIDIPDGQKNPVSPFTDSMHQHEAAAITGNYGLLAGDSLLFVDVDDYRGTGGSPDIIQELPITFTVKTPHGGQHYYFISENRLGNKVFDWGELRVTNQIVVGPGSELYSCNKTWHRCSDPDEGDYKIHTNTGIANLPSDVADKLRVLGAEPKENPEYEFVEGEVASKLEEIDTELDLEYRLQKAQNSKKGEIFTALWEGRYTDAGFNDRSDSEAALCRRLMFWMENNVKVVKKMMDVACHWHPMSDLGMQRKWIDSTNGKKAMKKYQQLTLAYAELPEEAEVYESDNSIGSLRPEVSYITRDKVMWAIHDLQQATASEILSHEDVDRGKRQVQKAINQLEEADIVGHKREGRSVVYFIDL